MAFEEICPCAADWRSVELDYKVVAFDYDREAELFPARTRKSRGKSFGYQRFERAADAIQFAMEVLPAQSLAGAYLEVDEQRFDAEGIRVLYESPEYPLIRSATAAASVSGAGDPEQGPAETE